MSWIKRAMKLSPSTILLTHQIAGWHLIPCVLIGTSASHWLTGLGFRSWYTGCVILRVVNNAATKIVPPVWLKHIISKCRPKISRYNLGLEYWINMYDGTTNKQSPWRLRLDPKSSTVSYTLLIELAKLAGIGYRYIITHKKISRCSLTLICLGRRSLGVILKSRNGRCHALFPSAQNIWAYKLDLSFWLYSIMRRFFSMKLTIIQNLTLLNFVTYNLRCDKRRVVMSQD